MEHHSHEPQPSNQEYDIEANLPASLATKAAVASSLDYRFPVSAGRNEATWGNRSDYKEFIEAIHTLNRNEEDEVVHDVALVMRVLPKSMLLDRSNKGIFVADAEGKIHEDPEVKYHIAWKNSPGSDDDVILEKVHWPGKDPDSIEVDVSEAEAKGLLKSLAPRVRVNKDSTTEDHS